MTKIDLKRKSLVVKLFSYFLLLFFTFENFSTLGGNKTERLNLKKSSSFRELRGNVLKVKLCHIFFCNKIVF